MVKQHEMPVADDRPVAVFGRQVAAQVSLEQGRMLDEIARARQVSVSAVVRAAIRAYLDESAAEARAVP